MRQEPLYMIDIETTGVNRETDDILQVGCLKLTQSPEGYFYPDLDNQFEFTVHSKRQPENAFAKKHMSALYQKCNETDPEQNYQKLSEDLKKFIHGDWDLHDVKHSTPKLFIGWNASNFDLPFLFDKGILIPSYYYPVGDKEEMGGDVHYRIYEQTGSVQLIADMTGLDRKTIEVLVADLNPTGLKLPKGKEHDALYDCFKQTIMQNGLIALGRMGIRKN